MKQNTFEKNQIIAYFDDCGYLVDEDDPAVYSYRKYLGKTDDGFFLIQDFYSGSHKIYSNEIKINTLEYIDEFYLPSCIEGVLTYWHKNGQKYKEETYINGVVEGIYTEWYENGQKSYEINFVNGCLNGLHSIWYKNGQKHSEENYINDIFTGEASYWHENGQQSSYKVVLDWGGPYADFGIVEHLDKNKDYTFSDYEFGCVKISDMVIDGWWKSLSTMKSYYFCYSRPEKGLNRYGVTLIPPESLDLLYDIVVNKTAEDFKVKYPQIALELLDLIQKARNEGKYIIHFGV
ncbi:toxin-antitoxin system YwqK family antitoxin [Neisseria sp. Ec49-e6-T10]|uniref:toxin-antitoxin system YwqK family antitoxin n=1 Tax=Neisseria sp. Ec49-e6-T10 TaxID=3140744 RepID=UPI003EBCC06C